MSGRDDILPPYELALDYFLIGGDRSPGKCEVRGAGREWEWAELAGWGLSGATLILRRGTLVEFEIDVTITTQTQLEEWDDFYAKWLKTPVNRARSVKAVSNATATGGASAAAEGAAVASNSTTSAAEGAASASATSSPRSIPGSRGLGIYHPRLARVGIGSAVVVRVGQFVQNKTGGETCTIKFKEYRAPKFVLTKPNGSIPGVAKPKPKARDALDEDIERETEKNKQLSAADSALGSLF